MNNNSGNPPLSSIGTPTVIKVAMADDHALYRTGVKTSLQSRKDIQIVAEAENGMQLLKLLKQIQPDIVLLDIQMPIMDGLTVLPEIKKLYPNVKVIILSMHNDHSVISKMIDKGASSYLTKESGSEMIYEAVRAVYEHGYFHNELTNQALLSGLRKKRTSEDSFIQEIQFTDDEIYILKLLMDERSTREIAEIINVSTKAVETIRDNLKVKTGLKSMADLFMYGVKFGVLDKWLEMTASKISKVQMVNLFKISTSILSYVNHDLAGQRATIYNSLDQLNEEIEKVSSNPCATQKINNLIERAFGATRAITSINNLIKSYANQSRSTKSDRLNSLFISSPFEIIRTIKDRNKNANISTMNSDDTLKIIYPNIILASILTELAENAKKNSEENVEIMMKWGVKWDVKEKIFQFEIHDNGVGFVGLKTKGSAPLGFLQVENSGMGLKIIDRTVIDSGGRLLFSKSELLKGAKVNFEFPVIDFTSEYF